METHRPLYTKHGGDRLSLPAAFSSFLYVPEGGDDGVKVADVHGDEPKPVKGNGTLGCERGPVQWRAGGGSSGHQSSSPLDLPKEKGHVRAPSFLYITSYWEATFLIAALRSAVVCPAKPADEERAILRLMIGKQEVVLGRLPP